jgi:hypothetical protein
MISNNISIITLPNFRINGFIILLNNIHQQSIDYILTYISKFASEVELYRIVFIVFY